MKPRAWLAAGLTLLALALSGGMGTAWAGLGHAVPNMPPQPGQGSVPSDPGPVGAPAQPSAPGQPSTPGAPHDAGQTSAPTAPQAPAQPSAPSAPADANAGTATGGQTSGSGTGGGYTGSLGGVGVGAATGSTPVATGTASGTATPTQGSNAGKTLSDIEFLDELTKAIAVFVRTQKFLESELAKPGTPDPGKLKTVATATGQRGDFYRNASDNLKKIIDEFEGGLANNIKDVLRLLWGWLPPNGGKSGLYRKHYEVELTRTQQIIDRLKKEREAILNKLGIDGVTK